MTDAGDLIEDLQDINHSECQLQQPQNAISNTDQWGAEDMTPAKNQGNFEWYIMEIIIKFKRNNVTFEDSRIKVLASMNEANRFMTKDDHASAISF